MMREFWGGKRVFITGHTGFKGGWLALWHSNQNIISNPNLIYPGQVLHY